MKKLIIAIAIGVLAALSLFFFLRRGTEGFKKYSGYLEWKTVKLAFEKPGKILILLKDEGETVRKNDTIAIVDTLDVVFKLNSIKAQIEAISSEIDALESQLNYLITLKASLETLRDRGVSSDKLRKLSAQLGELRAKRAALIKKRESLQENFKLLQEEFKRCFLISTLSGVVVKKYFEANELYTPPYPVVEIGNPETLVVYFYVPKKDLGLFNVGDTVFVKEGKNVFKAWITYIKEEAEFTPKIVETEEEKEKLVFKVKAELLNKGKILKAGMPVYVYRHSPRI